MDKGPWSIRKSTAHERWVVDSGDFKHDVTLGVIGDFTSDGQQRAYCEWLATTLNRPEPPKEQT